MLQDVFNVLNTIELNNLTMQGVYRPHTGDNRAVAINQYDCRIWQ